MKYEYFVSFGHNAPNQWGIGNTTCILDFKVDSTQHYEKLNSLVKEWNPDAKNIVITNFVLLRKYRESRRKLK